MQEMRRRRILAGLAALAMSFSVLAGCGRGQVSESQPQRVDLQAGEKVKVEFWHAMGGKTEEAVNQLVAEFNRSQDKVQVEAKYQGTYDESLQKLKASGPNGPTLIQVYEIGSRFMIDSGLVTPMQSFIDADQFKTADFEPNILAYYTFDGKLQSMPFNTSTPIVYYNKTAFQEAGLNPDQPPKTFDEFREAAKQLTKTEGGETRYGASIALYGWFFEQLLAVQGAHYVDGENGRNGKATRAMIASPEGVKILDWMKRMVDDGSAVNLGRKTSETQAAFQAGRIAMTMDSTAALANMLGGVGDKFEVGTAFLPRPEGANGGVIIGGASLWITNIRPEKEQWAAWEFVKWLSGPEAQAKWSAATGYFPIRKSAHDLPVLKELHAQRPQFKTAVDQLRSSRISPATQGAVIGVFPQARQTVEGAMEAVILGQKSSQAALQEAEAAITRNVGTYNRTTVQ